MLATLLNDKNKPRPQGKRLPAALASGSPRPRRRGILDQVVGDVESELVRETDPPSIEAPTYEQVPRSAAGEKPEYQHRAAKQMRTLQAVSTLLAGVGAMSGAPIMTSMASGLAQGSGEALTQHQAAHDERVGAYYDRLLDVETTNTGIRNDQQDANYQTVVDRVKHTLNQRRLGLEETRERRHKAEGKSERLERGRHNRAMESTAERRARAAEQRAYGDDGDTPPHGRVQALRDIDNQVEAIDQQIERLTSDRGSAVANRDRVTALTRERGALVRQRNGYLSELSEEEYGRYKQREPRRGQPFQPDPNVWEMQGGGRGVGPSALAPSGQSKYGLEDLWP